jgi:hypothetical protein
MGAHATNVNGLAEVQRHDFGKYRCYFDLGKKASVFINPLVANLHSPADI